MTNFRWHCVYHVFDGKRYKTLGLMGEVYNRRERAAELTAYLRGLEGDLKQRSAGIAEADKPSAYVGGVSFRGAHGFEGTGARYSPFYAIGANNGGADDPGPGDTAHRGPDFIPWGSALFVPPLSWGGEKTMRVERLSFFSPRRLEAVLEDISFEAAPGEMTAVLGNNGAGKSTLLKCLCRILRPRRGAVFAGDLSRFGLFFQNKAKLPFGRFLARRTRRRDGLTRAVLPV